MTYSEDSVYKRLSREDEHNVARIREFLRQPSVASSNLGGPEGAGLLASYYKDLGCKEVELLETDGFPGVWAFLDSGSSKTIISYCMYDTKPPQAEKWSVPPYDAILKDVDGLGKVVIAPGAKSRKAPYIQWLNAMRAMLDVEGRLPVNVAFLAEGEENVGSPHYSSFVDRYADRLKGAVGCLVPGASQNPIGELTIHLGYKGLIYAKISVSGERWGWGPQKASAHGMAQVVVGSPVWRLVAALNSVFDGTAQEARVQGLWDSLAPPSDSEMAEIRELVSHYGDVSWNQIVGGVGDSRSTWESRPRTDLLAQYLYQPSFNLNGLSAGFVGPGAPVFTLPKEASAYLDIRVPRGYSTSSAVDRIRQHLDHTGFADVDLDILSAHEPSHTSRDSEFVITVNTAIQEAGYDAVYWPYSSGGGPWSRFASEFRIPVLFDVGLGHGGRGGGPDEYLVLDSYCGAAGNVESEFFYVSLLRKVADL